MKILLRHGICTCIYRVKRFSRWNIPKRRSETKIGENQCSGALQGLLDLNITNQLLAALFFSHFDLK